MTNTVHIPADVYYRAASNAYAFTSGDDARPVLASAYLHRINDVWRFTATDSYTMLIEELPTAYSEAEQEEILIPRRVLKLTAPLVRQIIPRKGTSPNVVITFNESGGEITIPGVGLFDFYVKSKTTFPDYKTLIPADDAEPVASMVAFNPEYVARIARLKVEKKRYTPTPAKWEFFGPIKPARCRLGENITALIMPVRVSE